MIRAIVCLFVILPILAGCATPYAPMGFMGGVADLQLSDTMYQITAKGNGSTTSDRIQDFVLLRASQIAIARNYKGFVINRAEDRSSTGQIVIPGYAMTNSYGSATAYGNSAFGSVNSTSTYLPPTNLTFVRPGEAVIVTLVNSGGMDANLIFSELAPKYGVTTTAPSNPAAPVAATAREETEQAAPQNSPAPNADDADAPNDDAKVWFQKSVDASGHGDWPEVIRTSTVAIAKEIGRAHV